MTNPINILHVVERIDDCYGGPAKSIPYLAHFSTSDLYQHQIYSGRYELNDRNTICELYGLSYTQFGLLGPKKLAFSVGLTKAIYAFIKNKKNPIVHIHNAWNFVPFSVWMLSLALDFKIIVSTRGALFEWSMSQGQSRKLWAWRLFQKRLLLKADAIHVTSEDERQRLIELGLHENIKLIPNGVCRVSAPEPECTPRVSRTYPLRLLFASRIHPKKGFEILLAALASESISFNIELIVAGDFCSPSYRKKLDSLLICLGPNVSTRFLGHVSPARLSKQFLIADLFVLPSHTENFGIVIAEALSHGVPVITTKYTPWLEIKTKGAGYIIDTSVKELADSIADFNDKDKYQRAQMATKAKLLIEQYYWPALSVPYRQMYCEVIA